MSYWDKHPINFRIIVICISAALLFFMLYYFIMITGYVTDENLYADPPSRAYLLKEIPAYRSNIIKDIPDDTIGISYLIIDIKGIAPKNSEHLFDLIDKYPNDELIKIKVVNSKELTVEKLLGRLYNIEEFYVKKSHLNKKSLMYLSSAVIILHVQKEGSSERGGIKKGDYIIKVNGQTFSTAVEADKHLRVSESGSIIRYQVLRNNRIFDVQVKLVKFGVQFVDLIIFLDALLFFGFGAFIAISRPRIKAARLLGLGMLLVGYHFFCFFKSYQVLTGYVGVILYYIVTVSGFPIFLHSTLFFPRERQELIKKKWLIITPYIFGTLIALVFTLNVALLMNATINIILIYTMNNICLLAYFYKIITNFINRKYMSSEHRKLTRAIKWTFIIAFFAVVIVYLLRLLGISRLGYIYLITISFIPLAYIYTIGRYNLLDLKIRIKRNIQYILISAFLKLCVLAVLITALWLISLINIDLPNLHLTGTTLEVLDKPLNPEKHRTYQNFLLVATSLICIYIFLKAGKKIQRFLDRKYYRTRFDYRRASNDFSEILAKKLSISDLARDIVNELGQLIHLKRIGILFFKNEKNICGQEFYGISNDSIKEFCLVTAQKLIEAIKDFHGEFRIEYLPEPMKGIFQKCKFQYLIPIRTKEKIVGALLVGEKLSETSFHREDIEFLNSIAGQISVAIENALLYEDLAQQERIKHELHIARRIQLASLPQVVPVIEGLDISGISLPALEVGGDFYDFLDGTSNELTVIVGDVSGKGTSAALYMSKVQGIMRTLHEFNLSPKDLFIRTNQLLYKYLEKSFFITAVGARIDTLNMTITLARAGHIPMYFYKKMKNEILRIVPKGIVLGMDKGGVFDRNLVEVCLNYNEGDVFLFISDGVIEARNIDNQDFAEDRLFNVFRKYINQNSDTIRDGIVNEVMEFSHDMLQYDDLTIVVVKAV